MNERSGFTLTEMAIASTLLVVVAAGFVGSVSAMRRLSDTRNVQSRLQLEGAGALEEILDELRLSGFVTPVPGGPSYPYLFQDGGAAGAFAAHAHPPAAKTARPNEYDFGPSREIVFLLPADADGDDVPDLDANGELVFGADEISYVHVTRADGSSVLERRVNGATPRVVARDVERVVFDDAASSGFEVPLGAVRVRIFFRAQDRDGLTHRRFVEASTRLRNG